MLGEQYEKWEFDLVILADDRLQGCDSYVYLRNLYLLGKKAEYVELIFSMDILIAVYIKFNIIIFSYLIKNSQIINNYQMDIANNILFYKR
ncbi:hypothetical protein A4G24_16240 [Elizabethkingia anophelis]|nr:hypothetical protein A4G24_16240 [Elizabethkingia anophelis]